MSIKKFEDILAWQKAKELAKHIYELTNEGDFAKDYALKNQIRRAALSPMSNIAEGYARQTDKEFVQFLYIALGSIAEVQSQLHLSHELGYLPGDEFDRVLEQSREVARLVNGLLQYLKRK
ncbi:MAG: four helix bundle protein [Chloroflexi bacterium]|nr:four helix bundle protein [Chloroflexota bacterium]